MKGLLGETVRDDVLMIADLIIRSSSGSPVTNHSPSCTSLHADRCDRRPDSRLLARAEELWEHAVAQCDVRAPGMKQTLLHMLACLMSGTHPFIVYHSYIHPCRGFWRGTKK